MMRVPTALPEVDADVIRDLLKAVNAMAHDPDHLPLFQHCLYWLWLSAGGVDGDDEPQIPARITRAHLTAAVGDFNGHRDGDRLNFLLTDCLDYRADRAFATLSDEDRDRAQRLFTVLGIKDHEQRYKRTPLRLSRLPEIGLTRENFAQLAQKLNRAHPYLRETANDEVDICHEALIRKWRKFRGWVDEEYDRADNYRRIAMRLAKWRALGSPRDRKDEWLYEKVATNAKDTGLLDPDITPLKLEQLYPWEEDPLGIAGTPEKLPATHAAIRKFIEESLAYHKGVRVAEERSEQHQRRLRYGMSIACALGALIGFAWLLNYLMGERELRALYSNFIAGSNSRSLSPGDTSPRRLAHLWQGMVANNLFHEKDEWAWASALQPFEILIDPFGRRRDRLRSTETVGEATLGDSFKDVLASPMLQDTTAKPSRSVVPDSQAAPERKGPRLARNGDDYVCIESSRPTNELLRITGQVVLQNDGSAMFAFPPEARFKMDQGCEVVVAAVPQGGSWSLQLTYITWRKSSGDDAESRIPVWVPARNDGNRSIPYFNSPKSLEIDAVQLVGDYTVELSLVEDGQPKKLRVASLRPEPWATRTPAGLPNAQLALTGESATASCPAPPNGKAGAPSNGPEWRYFPGTTSADDKSSALPPLCIAVSVIQDAPSSGSGSDDAGSGADAPGEMSSDVRVPRQIQFFPAASGFRGGSYAARMPLARVLFTGPPIAEIRVGTDRETEGWIEIRTVPRAVRSRAAPVDAGSTQVYIAPALLPALHREACNVAINAPAADREILRASLATNKLNDLWNIEYDVLRSAAEKLGDKHNEMIGLVNASAGASDNCRK